MFSTAVSTAKARIMPNMKEKNDLVLAMDPRALRALALIESSGAEAWLVGGCVRDALIGRTPHDFDIASSAPWKRTAQLFRAHGMRVIETGARHGSICAVVDGLPVEITSYRIDGVYGDRRRPDSIAPADDIESDLARRDFTMNATAFHPQRGLIDPFSGRRDMERDAIRCVGDASARFEEDPLRIMRALRFASQLGFSLDEAAEAAAARYAFLVRTVARERVYSELVKLLEGPDAGETLRLYSRIAASSICPDDERETAVWDRAMRDAACAVAALPPDAALRFAAIAACRDDDACAHAALQNLKAPRRVRERVRKLLEGARRFESAHPTRRETWFAVHGLDGDTDLARDVLALREALAASEQCAEQARRFIAIIEEMKRDRIPFKRSDLAVSGSDLAVEGIARGADMGPALERLLIASGTGRAPNERAALLALARDLSWAQAPRSSENLKKRSKTVDTHESHQ